jgi:predicted GNAT family N-acyltransferase
VTSTPLAPRDGLVDNAGALEIVEANPGSRWGPVLDIRRRVFAEEQGLVDLGIADREDETSLNLLALLDGSPAGVGRLSPPGATRPAYLSWIATVPEFRGRGIASAIVERLLAAADRRGYPEVHLAAQAHAIGLYERFGFEPRGAVYVVRGIPHQTMARRLKRSL